MKIAGLIEFLGNVDPDATANDMGWEEFSMKLEDRVIRSIARRKGVVVQRSELGDLGSPAQLTRVLAALVKAGRLVRASRGMYVKTRINRFTKARAPVATFETIAAEVFRKLKIDVTPGKLTRDYNANKTTQLPMQAVVNTGGRRITRKIQIGSRSVTYERRCPNQRKGRQP
ncbi:DUF6088 family protein [Paraburkholderia sediminicola]|uniref:DUF6088 family protein n=1 Tax=Paraburkholderia sediminicola TaxID=458836 RepID=UPI0038BCBACD